MLNFNAMQRWNIRTNPIQSDETPSLSEIKPSIDVKSKLPLTVINNYFSIGADAKIALDFHSARGI